ncbi:hypothetical protein BC937DRAFT_88894 [Endogone sp. FLAS-F59071]|nr:hypothetical protein BC937DRAFT_88894 [Endogone sp. FLAS-F59071]|eukprot:RUS23427.1 hypothetical protein BC937DRAFT_88894 [Endogone sp. FLAS-F59071]
MLTYRDTYVGSAVDLARRLSEHMREPSMLVAWEQLAIDLMRPRYNILQMAGNLQGFKWSPENIAKISE